MYFGITIRPDLWVELEGDHISWTLLCCVDFYTT